MRALFLLLTVLVPAARNAAAQQLKPKTDADELVRRLADRSFAVREAAATAIRALGTQALPALRRAQKSSDPEVRARVAKWIPQLEAEVAVAPRLITLHLKQKTLPEIVAVLSKQSGYKIEVEADVAATGRRFDFDFDNAPFLTALDGICSRADLGISSSAGSRMELTLGHRDDCHGYVQHHGAFRITLNQINYELRKSVFLWRSPTREKVDTLSIGFTIDVEPRLALLASMLETVTVARDDRKHSMIPPPSQQSPIQASNGVCFVHGNPVESDLICASESAGLCGAAPGATTIEEVKGTFLVTIGTEHKRQLISEKPMSAKGKRVRCGEATVEITNVRETSEGYEVSYACTSRGFASLELQLADAHGRLYARRPARPQGSTAPGGTPSIITSRSTSATCPCREVHEPVRIPRGVAALLPVRVRQPNDVSIDAASADVIAPREGSVRFLLIGRSPDGLGLRQGRDLRGLQPKPVGGDGIAKLVAGKMACDRAR